ncbi:E3 ubiquitin-protein ligase upl1 [Dionaea muscipula]
MQKSVDSVLDKSSKRSVVYAEALLSPVTVLVSSSSGCSAMREAGFIPTLLPLLKDTNPQHLHLVSTAVHVLEAFMDYSNPAAALFRDLGGLDNTVFRLEVEVSIIENGSKQPCEDSSQSRKSHDVAAGPSSVLDDLQPLYSDALVAHHQRILMKALLRVISLGTYAPALDTTGLPSAFIDAIVDGVVCSAEAITCIPHVWMPCALTILAFKLGLDELMRHASAWRGAWVEMLIEILNTILRIGSGSEAPSSYAGSLPGSTPAPMETDAEEKNLPPLVDKMPSNMEVTDLADSSNDAEC